MLSLYPKNGLGLSRNRSSSRRRYDRDLVLAADAGQDGLDLGVGERGMQVVGAGLGRGAGDPGRRVLHRDQVERLPQPAQAELEHFGEVGRGAGGG